MTFYADLSSKWTERAPNVIRHTRRALPFVLGALACLILDGFAKVDWTKPYGLSGDALFLVASIKNVLNGFFFRFNTDLGFPGTQDMLSFPLFEFSFKAQAYIFSWLTSNVFIVLNFVYASSIFLMFFGSYLGLRRLSFGPWLSSLASIGFVVSPFFVVRVPGHDNLGLYYSVPLGATLALVVGSMETGQDVAREARRPWFWWAIAIVGSAGLYYAFFSAMFIMVAGVSGSIARRSWIAITVAIGLSATILFVLVLSGYGPYVTDLIAGRLPRPPKREVYEQLFHGMWPATAVGVYASIGLWTDAYHQLTQVLTDTTSGPGGLAGEAYAFEWPGVVLTSIILLTPLMVVTAALRPERRFGRGAQIYALSSALAAFGLVFATRGGLGFVFNYMIDGTIRAQERIIPFLAFFAVVLFCLGVQQAQRIPWPWARVVVCIVSVSLLLAASWPSAWRMSRVQQAASAGLAEVTHLEQAMLARKDALGLKAVFQLPETKWPEVPVMRSFDPYTHQLPYIFDRVKSDTRWSYGLTDRQPEFEQLNRLSADELGMAQKARGLGFDGILIEKAAYEPAALQTLLDDVAAQLSEPKCRIYDDPQRTLFYIGTNQTLDCSGAATALTSDLGQVIGVTNIAKGPCGYAFRDPAQIMILDTTAVENVTLSFWVRPQGQQAPTATILSDHDDFRGITLEQDGSSDLSEYKMYAGDGDRYNLVGTVHLDPGHWYHVTIEVGSSQMQARITGQGDPVEFGTDAAMPGVVDFHLGNWHAGGRAFHGDVTNLLTEPVKEFSPLPPEQPQPLPACPS